MKVSGMLLAVSAANVLYPLLFSLCTVVAIVLFVWLMVRFVGKNSVETTTEGEQQTRRNPMEFAGLLPLLLVIGLVVRLIFVFAVKGYRPEINQYIKLFDSLKSNGFSSNYYTTEGTSIFPVTYYIYSLMGLLVNALGLESTSVLMPFFIKLPLIAADLITALILYKIAKKYLNASAAIVVAGFVCVCPVFVFASGVWATQYSLLAMFLVLTLYFLVQKNYIALIGCYSAALLTHKEAIYLFPLVAVIVIYNLVKACKEVHTKKGIAFKDVLHSPEMRPVFTIPVSIVGFCIVSYLFALPLTINSFGAGFFTFIYQFYLKPLATFDSFGHNSLGIFNLFMRNGVTLTSRFPSVVFAVLFAVIITAIVLLVYLTKKNRANMTFLAAYIYLTLATYFVGFSEFSLLTTLAMLLFAFLLVRDKRFLMIFAVLALVVTVNATSVMSSAMYYNNLADYYVGIGGTSSSGYIGSLLLSGGAVAVTIVCSAIAVLAHLYATVVLLDISMSNKRRVLPYLPDAGFGTAMREFMRLGNKKK